MDRSESNPIDVAMNGSGSGRSATGATREQSGVGYLIRKTVFGK
jgi:hypothetical protein